VDFGRCAGRRLALAAGLGLTPVAGADLPNSGIFRPYIADHLVYDDNLFRLANWVNPNTVLGPGMSKWDVVNQFTAGGHIDIPVSRQTFLLNLRLDDNRFANNKDLDNLSTDDMANWKWKLGRTLSGNSDMGMSDSLLLSLIPNFFLRT